MGTGFHRHGLRFSLSLQQELAEDPSKPCLNQVRLPNAKVELPVQDSFTIKPFEPASVVRGGPFSILGFTYNHTEVVPGGQSLAPLVRAALEPEDMPQAEPERVAFAQLPAEGSSEWRLAMLDVGERMRLAGVRFAIFAHGSFVGNDPLAIARAVENAVPFLPDLARAFFNDAPIQEDQSLVTFEAPARAEDAALVPMSFSAKPPEGDPRRVVKLTLVVDQNPVPLAAAFTLGEKAGDTRISTRVRVNSYTNVRVVAELSDGSLHMATRYIKASGGCSAPMVKSMDEAMAALGQMKFRILPPTPETPNEALLIIRHPNNSGLQMDQVTRLYTPARYVDKLRVYQGDDLVFSVEGGISISEDPNFRFDFARGAAKTLRVEAGDIDNAHFHAEWPLSGGS